MSKFISYENENLPTGTIFREHLQSKSYNFSWQIRFSLALDPNTVNNTSMFVTNPSGDLLHRKIIYNTMENYIEIRPLEHYEPNSTYTLTITTRVKAVNGKTLKEDIVFPFSIE